MAFKRDDRDVILGHAESEPIHRGGTGFVWKILNLLRNPAIANDEA
jgi:hypothetical protein